MTGAPAAQSTSGGHGALHRFSVSQWVGGGEGRGAGERRNQEMVVGGWRGGGCGVLLCFYRGEGVVCCFRWPNSQGSQLGSGSASLPRSKPPTPPHTCTSPQDKPAPMQPLSSPPLANQSIRQAGSYGDLSGALPTSTQWHPNASDTLTEAQRERELLLPDTVMDRASLCSGPQPLEKSERERESGRERDREEV